MRKILVFSIADPHIALVGGNLRPGADTHIYWANMGAREYLSEIVFATR